MGVPLLTQGIRLANQSPEKQWQELLYARLNCQYERLSSGLKTQKAEDVLEIGSCVYYYIHRIEPDFSSDVVLFEHNVSVPSDGSCCMVSPFDTGGLAAGYIVYQGNCFKDNVEVVKKYSYTRKEYSGKFIEWAKVSFNSVHEYITGVEPRNGYAAPLSCAGRTDECHPRLWTWEMRVRKTCASDNRPLIPRHLFITPERHNQYFNWLRSNERVSKQERMEHMTLVQEIVTVTEDVSLKVQDFLAQKELW